MSAPILQSLLLADQVYQDRDTGKYVICGVFNRIFLVPRPAELIRLESSGEPQCAEQPKTIQVSAASIMRAGSPFAYLSLTDVKGEKEFELRYVSLKDNAVLLSCRFRIRCDDPAQTVEVRVPLPELPQQSGEVTVYSLELLCDNYLLGSHRVHAIPGPTS